MSTKEDVMAMQEVLRKYGYTGEIDGNWGKGSAAAWRKFQQAVALDHKHVGMHGRISASESTAEPLSEQQGDTTRYASLSLKGKRRIGPSSGT